MKLTIDIPDAVGQSLQLQVGMNLEQAAKEALAVAWYQAEKLSLGQVAEFLGISVYEADGLLKKHQVEIHYSLDEFEQDQATLERLLGS